jgi:23S rRNA (uracil1939-C5)-methyltransferase
MTRDPRAAESEIAGQGPRVSEVALHGVAHGGEAVGRTDNLVTFVAYGLPGERVLVEILQRKPTFQRGRTREVVDSAPERVIAPCPIFGTCGGCHWQHAAYEAQLEFKTTVLRDQLQRIAKIAGPPVEAAIPSPQLWHYRNVVQMVPQLVGSHGDHVPVEGARGASQRLLCFQRAHSHDPVPVEHCYISDELINRAIADAPWGVFGDAAWASLREVHLRVVPGRDLQIMLIARRPLPSSELSRFAAEARAALPSLCGVVDAVNSDPGAAREQFEKTRVAWGTRTLTYELGGNRLQVDAGAFFQVNLGAAECLVRTAVEWLDPHPEDRAVDAYAGVGTFALALAPKVQSVLLVEAHNASIVSAITNAAANGHANVLQRAGAVEKVLSKIEAPVDLLLLDPPRRGCGPDVVRQIARLRPRRIAYVSCEPSTLARDVRDLCTSGYRLTRSRVVDMFPQTFHLESVSLLETG